MGKILLVIMLVSTLSYGKMFDVNKFGTKLAGKNIDKVVESIKKSDFTKNIPELKLKKGLKPELSVIALIANKIAKKGNFEDKFITKTIYPLLAVQQYARYGDGYLNTMKHFSKKVVGMSADTLKQLKQKFPNMPKMNFKSTEEFNDKMVDVLKHTGKKGWKASQELFNLAKKYPKSTVVAGLYGWYVIDPESYFEQKEKLLAHLASTLREGVSDVTKLTLDTSSGVADGFMEAIKEKAMFPNILILVLALLSFVIWKLRSYIKRFIKIKLEQGLEKASNKKEEIKQEDEEEGLF